MTLPYLDLQPIYLSKILVCFDKEDWPEQTLSFNIEWPEGDVDGLCWDCEQNIYIAIKNIKGRPIEQVVDTISHEAYHAVVRLNRIICDESPSEEMIARCVGIITGFIFSEYLKKVTLDENITT